MSFGYGRAEVVAALVNYTTLIVLSVYLFYEGVMRFFEPEPINGWLVVWVAALALVVDLVTAALTYTMAKDSMNIRAAFIHNVADALGSIAVIVAGTAVILFGWTWVGPGGDDPDLGLHHVACQRRDRRDGPRSDAGRSRPTWSQSRLPRRSKKRMGWPKCITCICGACRNGSPR